MKYSLLYAEDDPDMAELNIEYFSDNGFNVIHVGDGKAALEKYMTVLPDIALLDVVMPGMDGFDVARAIRVRDKFIPILFLTSLSDAENAVRGLNVGGDDYIRKDAAPIEILSRLQTALRRAPQSGGDILQLTEKTLLDLISRELVIDGIRHKLSFRHYDLLYFLSVNSNKLYSRDFLASNIWGDMLHGQVYLNKGISALRGLLASDENIKITVYRGSGIILNITEK